MDRPKRSRASSAESVAIFPEQPRIGDRFTNADGEWEVASRPVTYKQGHFQPGADRHHVEGLATALETATQDREEPRAIPQLDFSSSPTTPTDEEDVSRA